MKLSDTTSSEALRCIRQNYILQLSVEMEFNLTWCTCVKH